MRISTRTRYGLRMMLQLAGNYGKGALLMKDIAEKEQISEKYLGQIVIPLRSAGLVAGTRGSHGGYVIGRDPEKITIKEIVEVLEGDAVTVECVKNSGVCERSPFCATRDIWEEMSNKAGEYLASVSLSDLYRQQADKSRLHAEMDYSI